MPNKTLRLALRVFLRSQAIAAPIGLTLACMNYISPNRTGLEFEAAATVAWLITTPVALVLSAATI